MAFKFDFHSSILDSPSCFCNRFIVMDNFHICVINHNYRSVKKFILLIFKLINLIGWNTGDWSKNLKVFSYCPPHPLSPGGNKFLKNCYMEWITISALREGEGYILVEAFAWGDQWFFLDIFILVIVWSSVMEYQIIKVPEFQNNQVKIAALSKIIKDMNLWKTWIKLRYIFNTVFHFSYLKTVWDK